MKLPETIDPATFSTELPATVNEAASSGQVVAVNATYDGLTLAANLTGLTVGAGNGVLCRNNSATVSRTLTGTTGEIDITNGNGSGGNPTFALASPLKVPLAQAGAVNFGMSVSGDTLTIQGQAATLSSTNKLYAMVPGSTPGLLDVLSATADVDLDIGGAVWELDGNGNRTGYQLSIYAFNDDTNGLGFAVSPRNGLKYIKNTDDETSAANCTSNEKVLVSAALTADAPCIEIGWCLANFTDSGDTWAWTLTDGKWGFGPAPLNHCHIRLNTFNSFGTTSTNKIVRFTNIDEEVGSIVYADSAADGASFTVKERGIYALSAILWSTDTNIQSQGFSLNASSLTTAMGSLALAERLILPNHLGGGGEDSQDGCWWTGRLEVDDVIRFHVNDHTIDSTAAATQSMFEMIQLAKLPLIT
jgi:hypothetical protein